MSPLKITRRTKGGSMPRGEKLKADLEQCELYRELEVGRSQMKERNAMTFEDLEAWQQARQLVNAVYTLTRAGDFSKDFRLCSQIQAAAVSIMNNILAREVAV